MSQNEHSRVYTRQHWAKADKKGMGAVHLLEHHLADVGACFEMLVVQPTIRHRLAHTGNRDDLDETTAARLAVFAALHDIGKVNTGFQTRIWRDIDLPDDHKPPRASHTSDLIPVLCNDDDETAQWFLDAIGWHTHISHWDADGGRTASALLVAALSHHGRPLDLYDTLPPNSQIWRRYGRLDPRRCVERIGSLVRDWFPAAFAPGGPPLPTTPAFQHMFLGLCTLADWIGSNDDHFPYIAEPCDNYITTARRQARQAMATIGLDIASQRDAFKRLPAFGQLFGGDGNWRPNSIQRLAACGIPLDRRLVVIESETGSGKTEAALWRFARMYEQRLVDGLYFALPTRTAATQLHRRVTAFVASMFPLHDRPAPVLAVPGYVRAGDSTGRHLPKFQVWWEDEPDDLIRHRRWAAEDTKRFLAAQIAVGTVDQAMMAALQVRHAHIRAAALARNLLVVDEVHASDPYMRVVLQALLDAHLGGGGYALLMSATLGSAARRRWLAGPGHSWSAPDLPLSDAIETPYPAVTVPSPEIERITAAGTSNQRKRIQISAKPLMHDFAGTAELALAAGRVGAKVLVIRNTVGHAVATQQAIEEAACAVDNALLFKCSGVTTLHTGRFAAADRRRLDQSVEDQLGRDRRAGGRILVGTQTLEQSLDIDADFLISDLCPMDVLLQRMGRLHRHGRTDRPSAHSSPNGIVLTPPGADLTPLLSSTRAGPRRNGLGGLVYPDLRILELTRRLVVSHAKSREPWTIPEMNRQLVELATHPDALRRLVSELDGEWRTHGQEIEGTRLADNLTANDAVVRRDRTFLDHDVRFGDVEQRIRTRLGDEGIELELDPAPPSPFDPDTRIPRLAIPGHLSRGLVPQGPIVPSHRAGMFEFDVDSARFAYDRLGLRKLE